MPRIEDNSVMEVSVVVRKAKASLMIRIFYKSHSQCVSIRRGLVDLLHSDGCVS